MKQLYAKAGVVNRLRSGLFLFVLLFAGTALHAQSRQITGVVNDANGPMAGVVVSVQGTTVATMTNADGRYSIQAAADRTLVYSLTGYTEQTVAVGTQSVIDVTLAEAATGLDEVVAIGYGTMRKRDLTGAVFSVNTQDIAIAPTSNVMEALQGRISGMDITKSSGEIGSDVSVLVRGERSIYGDNAPLFIIDGIPGEYSALNPSDIESLDVLKDASSTAIYGSAGANGVVIITTKKGKAGKATVNFDAYFGFSGNPKFPHGMMGEEWTAYYREAYKHINGNYPTSMADILQQAPALALYEDGKWIDWVEESSGRTAITQRYNFSVAGGGETTRIYASLNYEKDEGLLYNENQNSYQARLNLDQTLFPWATFGASSNLTYRIRNRGVSNTFTKSLSSLPLGTIYDEIGEYNYYYVDQNLTDYVSPLADLITNQFVNNTRSTDISANAYLEIRPLEGLSYRSTIYATLSSSRLGQYWGQHAGANKPTYAGANHASMTNNFGFGYAWDNVVNYNRVFAGDHNAGITLISSWSKDQTEFDLSASNNQSLDSWTFYNMLSGAAARIETTYTQKQKMSFAGRLNYSYKGRYLLSASMRRDGVSQFTGEKWENFPAASVGWRISDEPFMQSTQGWLNNLKLRVGWGITGNFGLPPYSGWTKAYAYGNTTAGITINGERVAFTQSFETYGNPALTWEKTRNVNIGIDAALLKNRIDLTFDVFNNRTTGLLFKRTMPITMGITGWGSPISSWENLAETSGKGFELTVNSRNIAGRDFNWNTTLTLSHSKNRIESLPSGDIIAESLFVGQPLKVIYGHKYTGIWSTEEALDPANAAYGIKPGWVKIETLPDADGNTTHAYGDGDRQILGHTNPDIILGLNNTFAYKGIDLSFFVMARYGQTINSGILGWYSATSGPGRNQIAGVDYWTEDNQGAYFPVPGSGDNSKAMGSLRVRDGSFIKVKNITLGYTLPRTISQKALMQRARVYATMYNPFIYVKDKQLRGTDPEMEGNDSFPLYKQFVFGVNITF